jgi:hypothetical protein
MLRHACGGLAVDLDICSVLAGSSREHACDGVRVTESGNAIGWQGRERAIPNVCTPMRLDTYRALMHFE